MELSPSLELPLSVRSDSPPLDSESKRPAPMVQGLNNAICYFQSHVSKNALKSTPAPSGDGNNDSDNDKEKHACQVQIDSELVDPRAKKNWDLARIAGGQWFSSSWMLSSYQSRESNSEDELVEAVDQTSELTNYDSSPRRHQLELADEVSHPVYCEDYNCSY